LVVNKNNQINNEGAHQTVSIDISTERGKQSLRIGFTDQQLTAHGGMVFWSGFLHKLGFRKELRRQLPHKPTSPNAYEPTDTALGFLGGVLQGADKFSRVAHLCSDPAIHEVLGVEAIASQSSLSRFFAQFNQGDCHALGRLHTWAAGELPSHKGGYTLDLDSMCLLHDDGHQEGVAVGYTPRGMKPSHHALIGVLAEAKMVVGFWLRPGNTTSGHNVLNFVLELIRHLPRHIRISCVRADAGFYNTELMSLLEALKINFIIVAKLNRKVQRFCRHSDEAWQDSAVPGTQVQQVDWAPAEGGGINRRLLVVRHKISQRPDAGGKQLLDIDDYRFQALVTDLPASYDPISVWRRYCGRGDSENRIKEIGAEFGIRGFCCKKFWATEAACHLAIVAYNLCVLLQGHLGVLTKMQLPTLRWQLFTRAAVWSRSQGRATLRLAVPKARRSWWLQVLEKLRSTLPPLNCNAVEFQT
jgi:hypothetical protein